MARRLRVSIRPRGRWQKSQRHQSHAAGTKTYRQRAVSTGKALLGRLPLFLVVAVLAGLATFSRLSPSASAHSEYDRSAPAEGATLQTPPERVDVWFTNDLLREPGQSAVEVYGPDGERIDEQPTTLDQSDATHLWVDVRSAGEGAYEVVWRIRSADGDPGEGSFEFQVAGEEGADSNRDPDDRDGAPDWALLSGLAAAAVVVALGAVLAMVLLARGDEQ